MRYKPLIWTKPGPLSKSLPRASVAMDVLKQDKKLILDPFFESYRRWKLLTSMISKYLKSASAEVDECVVKGKNIWDYGDGRVHADFNSGGAKTGRLSSSNPNLQNIPTPEKEPGTLLSVMAIKNIFTHTWEGGCLAAADYSGSELRMMAAISDCKGLKKAFNDGLDVHS